MTEYQKFMEHIRQQLRDETRVIFRDLVNASPADYLALREEYLETHNFNPDANTWKMEAGWARDDRGIEDLGERRWQSGERVEFFFRAGGRVVGPPLGRIGAGQDRRRSKRRQHENSDDDDPEGFLYEMSPCAHI